MNYKKNGYYFLTLVVLIGLFLRFLYFNQLTFGYDQARDALESISIIKNKDIKIIGPTTDIKGLFHSPLFWYIVSPFYYLSNGSPIIARIPMLLINLLNVLFIYFLANKLFKDKLIAIISALLMAVSFEAIQYGRWLSNPPPALLTLAVFFYGLWLVLNSKKIGLPLMVAFWSLSVDFQFFLVYEVIFIFFALIYLLIKDKKILFQSIKQYWWLYCSPVIFFLFYILAEIKFKFQGLKSLLGFFTKHEQASSSPLLPKLVNFLNSLIRNISNLVTVKDIMLAKIFLVLLITFIIFYVIKKKQHYKTVIFLFIWLISPILIYPLEKNNSYFLNIGNLYPLILLVVFMIFELGEKLKKFKKFFLIVMVGVIVIGNVFLVINENRKGEVLFSVQDQQTIIEAVDIIDYLYSKNKDPDGFAINTVTNPLLMNTTWAYLFHQYGHLRYSYMPHWLGYPLDGFGQEIKFNEEQWNQVGKTLYLIIEPTPGIPEDYIEAYKRYEDTRSKLIETKKFGNYTVEKRLLINNNHFLRDDLDKFL